MLKMRKFWVVILTGLFIATSLIANIQPVSAQGKNQYFLSFLYSAETKSFSSLVVQNDGIGKKEETYSKLNTINSSFKLSTETNGAIVAPGFMLGGTASGASMGTGSNATNYLSAHPYTFNEFGDTNGTETDHIQANAVGNALVKWFNAAIDNVLKPVSSAGRKTLGIEKASGFFAVATAVSNCGFEALNTGTSQNCSVGELTWTMKPATEADLNKIKSVAAGSSYKDYVVVVNKNKNAVVIPYLVPKGYSENQELYQTHQTAVALNTVTEKLSWGHVAVMASSQLALGSTTSAPGALEKEDALTKMVSSFFGNLVGKINSAIGIYSVEELFFSSGARSQYWFGIFPLSWQPAVSSLTVIGMILALIIIGISIAKMLIQRNLSSITPSMKADLMEGVKDLTIVMVSIALFMPMLYILLTFNQTIVSSLRNMAPTGQQALGLANGGGLGGIVSIILQLANLFVMLLINITFLIRAVTLALLISLAPLFISLFAAGPNGKKIATTFVKELAANIFLQAFAAFILLIYANISLYGNLSFLERFALLISFVPLIKFFRGLMNLGSGSDEVGSKTGSSLTNMVGSFAAGAMLSRTDGKSEKNGRVVDAGKTTNSDAMATSQAAAAGSTGIPNNDTDAKNTLRGRVGNAEDKARTILKNATKPGELGRIAGKAALMGAGVAISAGSAASGGSPLLGNGAMLAATKSSFNQIEGWGTPDAIPNEPESTFVAQGSEMNADGISGFNGNDTMFNATTRDNINENPETIENFKGAVQSYNEKPENIDKQASLLYKDDGKSIVGARIEGVSGKTSYVKDERGRVSYSESSYTGKEKLDGFKPVLDEYKNKKPAPEKAPVPEWEGGPDELYHNQ